LGATILFATSPNVGYVRRKDDSNYLKPCAAVMSTNRFGPQSAPLRYDPSQAFVPFTAISRTELIALNERLESARRELLREVGSSADGELAFVDRPERLLADYKKSRGRSELGRILAIGKRLRDAVDRVVVIDGGGNLLGARALFDAGCHPYHNELSRGDRGGRPRIYFVDQSSDNDAAQGLLDLLCHSRRPADVSERWAIAVVGDGGDTVEISPILCCLVEALKQSCGGDEALMGEFLLPIEGQGGCFSILSAAGLLPAAVMGMDIVRMLQGAAMMNERFRAAPPGDNPVLDYAGVSHAMEAVFGANSGDIMPWASALESTVRWCEYLQMHQRHHQHGSLTSGGLTTNLIVDSVRRDRLVVPLSEDDEADGETIDDDHEDLSGKSFPELQSAVLQGAKEAYALDRRPIADLHLPALDESALGQFFQMMMLATEIESRLNAVSPDSQPAASAHKSHTH
jgi:glucose-6-phosphate isomerase